jgi:hypothetical protein
MYCVPERMLVHAKRQIHAQNFQLKLSVWTLFRNSLNKEVTVCTDRGVKHGLSMRVEGSNVYRTVVWKLNGKCHLQDREGDGSTTLTWLLLLVTDRDDQT